MAWRFGSYHFVKEGTLDNTVKGKTTGEIEFAEIGKVTFELEGNMGGEFQGKRFKFKNPTYDPSFVVDHGGGDTSNAKEFMEGFDLKQVGKVGNIDPDPYLYIEWYAGGNGRCVIELDAKDFEFVN